MLGFSCIKTVEDLIKVFGILPVAVQRKAKSIIEEHVGHSIKDGICVLCGDNLSTHNKALCCFRHYTPVIERINPKCSQGGRGKCVLKCEREYQGGFVE